MRTLVVAALLAIALAAPAAATLGGSARAIASPASPGARAALAVSVREEMVCGRPSRGVVTFTLPSRMSVPRSIDPAGVAVQQRPAASVSVRGHIVSVGIPLFPPTKCHAIAPATLRIVFAKAAGLVNPRRAGSYHVRVAVRTDRFDAHLVIR